MLDYFKFNPNLLKSILLLVLAVSGNFVGNTLGCKTQFHMTNNMYIKHMLLIFITFFTLNYTASENENPVKQIFRALMIWGCFLLFTKQNITFTAISASIIIATYVLDTFSNYHDKQSQNQDLDDKDKAKHKETSELLIKIKDYSFKASILMIIIGFSLYSVEKYKEYGKQFNALTFIFGKTTCKSLSA